jgi:hypothetical protein
MTSRTTSVAAQREPELPGQTVVVIGGSAGRPSATNTGCFLLNERL